MYQAYIVEDDVIILDAMVHDIAWLDNGFEVVGYSSNPVTAIKEITTLSPDVVFSDLKMPVMDGNEMIRQLRKNNIECEFVMVSAFGTFEDSRTFFRQEGFDYLLKPLEQEQIQIILERLTERLAKKRGVEVTIPEGMSQAFIELIEYITANFSQKHSLDKLGARFNLNPNYICNLFAKHYNTTLTCFITRLRMEEAVKLMKEPGKAFKEIAVSCGYNDYFYFCKVFKEYYGMPPTQYKQEKLY